jgi:hypothetical protein
MIRVVLLAHLRTLAHVDGEVELAVMGQITQRSVLDTLEASYPVQAREMLAPDVWCTERRMLASGSWSGCSAPTPIRAVPGRVITLATTRTFMPFEPLRLFVVRSGPRASAACGQRECACDR